MAHTGSLGLPDAECPAWPFARSALPLRPTMPQPRRLIIQKKSRAIVSHKRRLNRELLIRPNKATEVPGSVIAASTTGRLSIEGLDARDCTSARSRKAHREGVGVCKSCAGSSPGVDLQTGRREQTEGPPRSVILARGLVGARDLSHHDELALAAHEAMPRSRRTCVALIVQPATGKYDATRNGGRFCTCAQIVREISQVCASSAGLVLALDFARSGLVTASKEQVYVYA